MAIFLWVLWPPHSLGGEDRDGVRAGASRTEAAPRHSPSLQEAQPALDSAFHTFIPVLFPSPLLSPGSSTGSALSFFLASTASPLPPRDEQSLSLPWHPVWTSWSQSGSDSAMLLSSHPRLLAETTLFLTAFQPFLPLPSLLDLPGPSLSPPRLISHCHHTHSAGASCSPLLSPQPLLPRQLLAQPLQPQNRFPALRASGATLILEGTAWIPPPPPFSVHGPPLIPMALPGALLPCVHARTLVCAFTAGTPRADGLKDFPLITTKSLSWAVSCRPGPFLGARRSTVHLPLAALHMLASNWISPLLAQPRASKALNALESRFPLSARTLPGFIPPRHGAGHPLPRLRQPLLRHQLCSAALLPAPELHPSSRCHSPCVPSSIV